MFIFAKRRRPNVKIVKINRNSETEVNNQPSSNGEQVTAESEAAIKRNIIIRRLHSSFKPFPKSKNCFIRPEDSFLSLGRGPVILTSRSCSLPDWAKSLLPPHPASSSFRSQNSSDREEESAQSPDSPSPSIEDEDHTETTSKAAEGGGKKAMRYTCRTCSERLPTLNSLRTHLKSHCRPLVQNQTPQLSLHSICMQARVVTSKYGRRRPVISAKKVPSSRPRKAKTI